jgi:hypothetical protein
MFGCADGDISVIVRVAICGLKMGPFFSHGRIFEGQKIVVWH